MQKARSHPNKGAPTACRRTVSSSFSPPCSGCFSPFPHGTGSLSVYRECLALADGPAWFTQDSSCPALLGIRAGDIRLRVRGSHPLRRAFPDASARLPSRCARPTTPGGPGPSRFGLCPVRSPLLGVSLLFSLPAGTKMFQFPAFAAAAMPRLPGDARGVAPFGHRRITGCMRLPAAFRSLPRPSSPPIAKVSTLRPSFLLPWVRRLSAGGPLVFSLSLEIHFRLPRTGEDGFVFSLFSGFFSCAACQ